MSGQESRPDRPGMIGTSTEYKETDIQAPSGRIWNRGRMEHTTDTIRVVIADDQELVRAGFAMVIGSQDDMTVVGQAADGNRAVSLVSELNPDVVLMDVRMPGTDGLEATRRISALSPDRIRTRVIILTTFDLDEYVMSAIKAGASGFLLKDTEPETLLSSIRTVHQGNAIIAPSATKRLIEHMALGRGRSTDRTPAGMAEGAEASLTPDTSHSQTDAEASGEGSRFYRDPEVNLLTGRELEVLAEIARGLSNQEIGDRLFISLPTVKTHVAHILQKINARDRVQAVVFAYENGLVQTGPSSPPIFR